MRTVAAATARHANVASIMAPKSESSSEVSLLSLDAATLELKVGSFRLSVGAVIAISLGDSSVEGEFLS